MVIVHSYVSLPEGTEFWNVEHSACHRQSHDSKSGGKETLEAEDHCVRGAGLPSSPFVRILHQSQKMDPSQGKEVCFSWISSGVETSQMNTNDEGM